MKRLMVPLVVALVTLSLAVAACTQSAPVPAPTKAPEPAKAPAAATQPPAATKAAAAPATLAPAKAPATQAPAAAPKVDYPAKGKNITMIVPYAAGGNIDRVARALAPALERQLGTTIQIVNKAGAASQVGLTELATSPPDGYTLLMGSQPTIAQMYLDEERKASFGRKDLQPVAIVAGNPGVIAVTTKSPYKTLKDLVDAAKAKPEGIKMATPGLGSPGFLNAFQLQDAAGIQFAFVHFNDGAAPALTSVLGGHNDVTVTTAPVLLPHVKSGAVHGLGVYSKTGSKFLPDVKTVKAQGYDLYAQVMVCLVAPAGTPKGIVDLLTSNVKKALDDSETQKRMDDIATDTLYLNPGDAAVVWDEAEADVKRLLKLMREIQ